jgi:hypothetical protein
LFPEKIPGTIGVFETLNVAAVVWLNQWQRRQSVDTVQIKNC